MADVTLSFGTYSLAEPTFAGWDSVLAALPAEDYGVVQKIALEIRHAPQGLFAPRASETAERTAAREEAMSRIADMALPLLRRVPRLAAAVVAACLRDGDAPVDAERVYQHGRALSDLAEVAAAMVEGDVLGRVLATAPEAHGIQRDSMRRLHARVVATCGWLPRDVWRMSLSDALSALRARNRRTLQQTRVLGAVISLAGADAALVMAELDRAADGARPAMTMEEQFGPQLAREVEDLARENEIWVRKQIERRRRTPDAGDTG